MNINNALCLCTLAFLWSSTHVTSSCHPLPLMNPLPRMTPFLCNLLHDTFIIHACIEKNIEKKAKFTFLQMKIHSALYEQVYFFLPLFHLLICWSALFTSNRCNVPCNLQQHRLSTEGYWSKCVRCHTTKTVREGSFLQETGWQLVWRAWSWWYSAGGQRTFPRTTPSQSSTSLSTVCMHTCTKTNRRLKHFSNYLWQNSWSLCYTSFRLKISISLMEQGIERGDWHHCWLGSWIMHHM